MGAKMQLGNLLSMLKGVKKSGEGFTAQCPSHEDKRNSLKVSQGDDGKILVKCHAGCEFRDIVNALELKQSDLFPANGNNKPKYRETIYKIQLSPNDILEHVRVDEPGGKRFFWRRNGKVGLNGLKLMELPLYEPKTNLLCCDESRVFLTEGEKAADALASRQLRAYGTICGAASFPGRGALEVLRDQDVILWADNDEAGQKHMESIRTLLKGLAKSVVVITTGDHKDDAADFKGSLGDLNRIIDKKMGIRGTRLVSSVTKEAVNSLALYCKNEVSNRIPTGINKLDQSLRGGMMGGALYLLGAPSGHGKTTLLQCIAFHCARHKGPVLFISPEMSNTELAEREIIRTAGISINEIAPWKHPNERLPRMVQLEKASSLIEKEQLPVHVVDDTDITMTEIRVIASKIQGLKLIIVDYAQEIADRATNSARYLAVGEVGKEAIVLGKALNVPVLVASQVNVFNEGSGKDYAFRETKDLEHRAHCSMIMEIKRSKTPNKYGYFDIESTRIFARKNRSGPVFSVDLEYNPAIFTIKNKGLPKQGTLGEDY